MHGSVAPLAMFSFYWITPTQNHNVFVPKKWQIKIPSPMCHLRCVLVINYLFRSIETVTKKVDFYKTFEILKSLFYLKRNKFKFPTRHHVLVNENGPKTYCNIIFSESDDGDRNICVTPCCSRTLRFRKVLRGTSQKCQTGRSDQ